MAKATQTTTTTTNNRRTRVNIKPKSGISGGAASRISSGNKRCPTCGKFMGGKK